MSAPLLDRLKALRAATASVHANAGDNLTRAVTADDMATIDDAIAALAPSPAAVLETVAVSSRLGRHLCTTLWRNDGADFGPWDELSATEQEVYRIAAKEVIYEFLAITSDAAKEQGQ